MELRAGGGGSHTDPRYDYDLPDEPHEALPFEIVPEKGEQNLWWSFAPEYYPDRFPQTKDKELSRHGQQCGGEDVSIKALKNREFHISGVLLASEVGVFNKLLDHDGKVNLYSPVSPSGGMECFIKHGEINATPEGWDAVFRMWRFEYSLDLVSTGYDEYERGTNAIVSAIMGQSSSVDYNGPAWGL